MLKAKYSSNSTQAGNGVNFPHNLAKYFTTGHTVTQDYTQQDKSPSYTVCYIYQQYHYQEKYHK